MEKLLDSLENAQGTQNIHFYLFQDGRLNHNSNRLCAAAPQQRRCLDLFNEAELEHKTTVKRGKNLGVPINQFKGINQVFANHDTAFFLENDLCVAPDYFETLLKILDKYGGVVKAAERFPYEKYNEPVIKRNSVSGTNWATTKKVWEDTKPYLEEFVAEMEKMDYNDADAKELIDKYGSATQDGIRCKAIHEAGYDIWETTVPKARNVGRKGVHGASNKLLKVTDEDLLCKIDI